MVNIYYSFPFATEEESLIQLREIKDKLKETSLSSSYYNFLVPSYSATSACVYGDILKLDKSDILLTYIPIPSIGCACELMYFKTKYPFKPIVGINCMSHVWLQEMINYRTNDIDNTVILLKALIEELGDY